jgi:hypothetical protein
MQCHGSCKQLHAGQHPMQGLLLWTEHAGGTECFAVQLTFVTLWCNACLQVATKVVKLSDASENTLEALLREVLVALQVSDECRHTCRYKGAVIKDNKFCLVMKRCVIFDFKQNQGSTWFPTAGHAQ